MPTEYTDGPEAPDTTPQQAPNLPPQPDKENPTTTSTGGRAIQTDGPELPVNPPD